MTTLIVFASVEGHTKTIAEFVEKSVRQTGQTIRLIDVGGNDVHIEFDGIKRVILAAPVHRLRLPLALRNSRSRVARSYQGFPRSCCPSVSARVFLRVFQRHNHTSTI